MDSILLEDNPHWIKSTDAVDNDYTHRELLDLLQNNKNYYKIAE